MAPVSTLAPPPGSRGWTHSGVCIAEDTVLGPSSSFLSSVPPCEGGCEWVVAGGWRGSWSPRCLQTGRCLEINVSSVVQLTCAGGRGGDRRWGPPLRNGGPRPGLEMWLGQRVVALPGALLVFAAALRAACLPRPLTGGPGPPLPKRAPRRLRGPSVLEPPVQGGRCQSWLRSPG